MAADTVSLRVVKRKLKRLNAECWPNASGHYSVRRDNLCATFATVSGRYVKKPYIRNICKNLKISKEQWDDA